MLFAKHTARLTFLYVFAAEGHKDGLIWIVRAADNLIEGRVWLLCEWMEPAEQRDELGNLIFIGQGCEEWQPASAIICKVGVYIVVSLHITYPICGRWRCATS